jgi:hypothetical protein
MSIPVQSIEGSLRNVRMVYGALLFSIVLYIVAAEMVGDRVPHDIHVTWLAFLACCCPLIVVAIMVRAKMVKPAAEILQAQPNDSAALGRWRTGITTSLVLTEAIALCGLAARFLGGTLLQATPFYAVAIALMLLWWPRRP